MSRDERRSLLESGSAPRVRVQREGISDRPAFELALGVQIGPGAQFKHFLRVVIKTCVLASQALMFTAIAIDDQPSLLTTVANWLLLISAGLLALDTALFGTGLPPLVRQIVDQNGERASSVPCPLRVPLSGLFAFFASAGAISLFTSESTANALLPSAAVPLFTLFALMLPYVGDRSHANFIELMQGGMLIAGATLGASTFALTANNNVAPDDNQIDLQIIPESLIALGAASGFGMSALINMIGGLLAMCTTPERSRDHSLVSGSGTFTNPQPRLEMVTGADDDRVDDEQRTFGTFSSTA